jgi:acyl carrier protein
MEEMKDGKKEEDTWTLVFNKVFSEYFDRAPEEPDVPLMQLGADSLVLAEISRALSHELQIQISVLDIFTQASFNKLYKHISTALTNSITISEN